MDQICMKTVHEWLNRTCWAKTYITPLCCRLRSRDITTLPIVYNRQARNLLLQLQQPLKWKFVYGEFLTNNKLHHKTSKIILKVVYFPLVWVVKFSANRANTSHLKQMSIKKWSMKCFLILQTNPFKVWENILFLIKWDLWSNFNNYKICFLIISAHIRAWLADHCTYRLKGKLYLFQDNFTHFLVTFCSLVSSLQADLN